MKTPELIEWSYFPHDQRALEGLLIAQAGKSYSEGREAGWKEATSTVMGMSTEEDATLNISTLAKVVRKLQSLTNKT